MIILLSILYQSVICQENFTVMCYNVLNFPNGEPLNRKDTLKTIVDFVKPDLILLQELKSEAGLTSVAEESCSDLEGNYTSAVWVPQQSNPNSSWPLQQNLVYNSDKFTLHQQNEILTDYRDFNEFILYYNSEELINEQDTAFLYVYVTHLKSSQGEDNEQLRLEMVENFTNHLTTVPENAQVLLGGDFNVYRSTEPSYELLLSDDNAIVLEDPIDSPGDWHSSSYSDKSVLTQSTRSSQIFNDGAGGGVDDRFDFMLVSSNMLDNSGGYQYVPNSYYALGNNGDCYNERITYCAETNFNVPQSVMLALYYMSDHLPVIMQMELDQTSSIRETKKEFFLRSNVVSDQLQFSSLINGEVTVYDASGKLVLLKTINSNELNISVLQSGIYLIKIEGLSPLKFVKE